MRQARNRDWTRDGLRASQPRSPGRGAGQAPRRRRSRHRRLRRPATSRGRRAHLRRPRDHPGLGPLGSGRLGGARRADSPRSAGATRGSAAAGPSRPAGIGSAPGRHDSGRPVPGRTRCRKMAPETGVSARSFRSHPTPSTDGPRVRWRIRICDRVDGPISHRNAAALFSRNPWARRSRSRAVRGAAPSGWCADRRRRGR